MYKHINELIAPGTRPSVRLSFHGRWYANFVYRDICAFANNYYLAGGGHIIIGANIKNGCIQRPVRGLTAEEINQCINQMERFNPLFRPVFHPPYCLEDVDGKSLLVIWVAPGMQTYSIIDKLASKGGGRCYYIRENAYTREATDQQLKDLFYRCDLRTRRAQFYVQGVTMQPCHPYCQQWNDLLSKTGHSLTDSSDQ